MAVLRIGKPGRHAAFRDDFAKFITSLADNVGIARIEVDMITFSGPDFSSVDNRLLSLLLVQQMLGRYKVKAPHLQPLHAEAFTRAKGFRRFSITHVPREDNKKADRLANLGADASERHLAGERFQRER